MENNFLIVILLGDCHRESHRVLSPDRMLKSPQRAAARSEPPEMAEILKMPGSNFQ